MSQIQVTGEAKIRDLQGPVVANSGVITALDGLPSQFVRGDGTLADIPSVTGGGSSVSYYLNGSVNQGTFGGSTYYELGENAITGIGTNFSTSTNGLLAQFITDAGVPDVTEIPSGNWNIEFYMGVSASSGALASFYVDIFKYDGTTFTLIGSNSSTPDFLTNTTTVDAYFTSVAMPLTAMAETDRIAIRVYANVAGKTVTLYTEDNRLCQVVTTFSRGMLSLNSLTDQQQYLTVGTAGTDFNIVSAVDTHTFNIPSASATNRGLITTGSQSIAGVKTFLSSTIQEGLSVLKNDAFQVISSGYTALTGYGLGGLTILQGDGTNVYNTDLDFPNTSNRQYTFPDITGTVALLQGTQTFTGAKTFSSTATFNTGGVFNNWGISLYDGAGSTALSSSTLTGIYASKSGSITDIVISHNAPYDSILRFSNDVANFTYTFPDLSGTIALTSDLSSYVPYIGATSSVDLGENTYIGGFVQANGTSVLSGTISLKQNGFVPAGTGSATIGSISAGKLNIYFGESGLKSVELQNDLLTASRTYDFPDASGTIALTSNLSSYVPYTGATANLDLGTYDFSAYYINGKQLTISKNGTIGGALFIEQGTGSGFGGASGVAIYSGNTNQLSFSFIDATATNSKSIQLNFSSLTNNANRTYTLPDASGTLALTSNLSAYVPYTGATGSVNLGIYTLNAGNIDANGISTSGGAIRLKQNGIINTGPVGYTTLSSAGAGLLDIYFGDSNLYSVELTNNLLTANRVYNFPNASGTLALTSNLSAYLLLTGGTLTGNLTIAKSDTLNVLTLSSTNSNVISFITSSVQKGEISANASNFQFNSFTTNGYIFKNSAANNVLSITDAGVTTLIGALSGTSATFSGGVTSNATTSVSFYSGTYVSNSLGDGSFATYSGRIRENASFNLNIDLYDRTAATWRTPLSFNNTGGAATFSSTLAVGTTISAQNGGTYAGSAEFAGILRIQGSGGRYFTSGNGLEFSYNSIYSYNRGTSAYNDLSINDSMVVKGGNGNVGIGTSSPATRLHIEAASQSYGQVRIVNLSGSATEASINMGRADQSLDDRWTIGQGTNGIANSFGFYSNGGNKATLSTAGVWSTTGGGTSDARTKDEIDYNFDNGVESILKLQPTKFKFKSAPDKQRRGFIAQDVLEVIPDLVLGDGELENGTYGLDYDGILTLAVKAIQEQQAQIEQLKQLILNK